MNAEMISEFSRNLIFILFQKIGLTSMRFELSLNLVVELVVHLSNLFFDWTN